jgi:hypothetical protein
MKLALLRPIIIIAREAPTYHVLDFFCQKLPISVFLRQVEDPPINRLDFLVTVRAVPVRGRDSQWDLAVGLALPSLESVSLLDRPIARCRSFSTN